MAKRRRRGVVLTPEGLEKFQAARLKLEARQSNDERYTYEKLSDISYVAIHTIKRVLECKQGVDKRTLERLFVSFDIELDENYYTKLPIDTDVVEKSDTDIVKRKKRIRRGVILTPEGLAKLQAAKLKHEADQNFGERYTYEKLSDITYIDISTIKRILECQEGVDKRTLERLFVSFEIELDENSYIKPPIDTYKLLKENYQLAIADYEEKYNEALKAKDEEIEMYKKQIKNLQGIIESLSKNPIVIKQITEG